MSIATNLPARCAVLLALALWFLPEAGAAGPTQKANGKLKIFILTGQSNMVGFGQIHGSPGTMEAMVREKPDEYGHVVDKQGKPVVRDDVWIVDISSEKRQGQLTMGYGAQPEHIGPEFGFGLAVGDYYEDPVLLIKSAWGGKSLKNDFLPPSAGEYPEPKAPGDTGFYYAEILRHVGEITGNLKLYCPDFRGKEYEIVGFGWHQGWNDRIDPSAVDAYEHNLVHLIKDLRKDLKVPGMLFVVANTGIEGWDINPRYKARVEKHVEAQLAVADAGKYPEFKGNVAGVETRDFWRTQEQSPSKQGFHRHRNWETYYLIGSHMGKAMIGLDSKR